ncbi:MAG TPA: PQQ-binding-like beta-propeller repeat protein, partial [Methanofastidiosum sp.]|nr:PQQ-binding-like beta-propeller repeat protein [Methanofastidiosum sp.]
MKWKTDFIGESIYASPAIGSDGTIYVGTYPNNGQLYAIKPDGTLKWKTNFIT